jgi:hypothetical protein
MFNSLNFLNMGCFKVGGVETRKFEPYNDSEGIRLHQGGYGSEAGFSASNIFSFPFVEANGNYYLAIRFLFCLIINIFKGGKRTKRAHPINGVVVLDPIGRKEGKPNTCFECGAG